MKKIITKSDIRTQINEQIAEYLQQGGTVQEIDRGISGRENPTGPLKPTNAGFSAEKSTRTYVPEVIAALEKRRAEQSNANKKTIKRNTKPRKKIIYDDFGEPLRWEWVD